MPSSRRSCLAVAAASMLAGTAFAAAPGVGLASDLRMTVEKPHFTCERHVASFSRAAFQSDGRPARPAALPCCDGQLGCAQFLSTNTVLRASRRHRS